MTEFFSLLQQGNPWFFIPSAILLGILHGLEPGHSKTMMAAFIVAVKGTVKQAVLLGLAATLSHTLIVWIIALTGLYLGNQWNAEQIEPYFQVASAIIMVCIALWMFWRTWNTGQACFHEHTHHDEKVFIDTGHGKVSLEIFETNTPPKFRLYTHQGQTWHADEVQLTTVRQESSQQSHEQQFNFIQGNGFIESIQEIPEPHDFTVKLCLGHTNHSHTFEVVFSEQHHTHDHNSLDLTTTEYQDAHELAHANDIKRRFSNQNVTTNQIIMFGLTGGLIPCPASITILLLCLQLKKIALGATLVLCFSIGLALTMVFSGVIAALSIKHASKRWSGFGDIARKAPYLSSGLILIIAFYVGFHGLRALHFF